jgi:8-oxo-dGTP pyrophosphatase MutT (NUDIX family)
LPLKCALESERESTVAKEQVAFQGQIVKVTLNTVELPNGKRAQIEIVHHPGGAAAVAIDTEQRVCLIRQYRPVFREWIWELPAGKLDPGEGPLATAQRELAEEAGVKAVRWTALGSILSSPGVFGETVYLYLAQDLTPVPSQTEEHELIEVHWVPLAEAVARASDGDINDGKTLAGLFRAIGQLKK